MSAIRTGAPMLSDRVGLVAAPTQLWAESDGRVRSRGVNGLYHGDWRILSAIDIDVVGFPLETIGVRRSTDRLLATTHCAGLDDVSKDPRMLVESDLGVTPGSLAIVITASNATDHAITAVLRVSLEVSFEPIDLLRAGMSAPEPFHVAHREQTIAISVSDRSVVVSADDARLVHKDGRVIAEWAIELEPGRSARHALAIDMADASLALVGAARTPWREHPLSGDRRLDRWLATAHADLSGLLLCREDHPDEPFVAAGAPWYLTLFGRDSLTAARMMLPLGTDLALGTLRALARLQGTEVDPLTAEQPGKILHEFRSAPIRIPRDGVVLPPVYFGTIDATMLWVTLLHATWRAGAPAEELRALLPALHRALAWMRDSADSDGDGFIEYLDPTGSGLANQGWKDSADAVRHSDGAAAAGPIALCEVQGYFCRAALEAADILEGLGEPGAGEWRDRAERIRNLFRARFWVERDGIRFPAIALDGEKRPVASLASNIGHLIGTGLLDAAEERSIAALLLSDRLSSGLGVRTLSNDESGYWRLSYHCGTVWPHDTAIIIEGMLVAGLHEEAATLASQLLDAAERFDFRMPELYSGDADAVAYPSSCQPQAWSAASAFVVARALTRQGWGSADHA